jgi:ABC-type polysaccharide/polyol phosphate transport system ATPase subunit
MLSSTSSSPVIRAVDLTKVYRLYTSRVDRLRDMVGMLGDGGGRRYSEHTAVDGLTLDVERGERIAIIGRNGSGKSTLLKLIARVIQPTSGRVDVTGKVNALLQIGTGFHSDLTGRQNVYAYFAQMGVTGHEADRRYEEVVDFAELHEYIEQPVKTYSTGMSVRLMFATSTAITPDLLILDEVLGVGDAYFTQKSFARIRELSDGGTTLLLVTHDVYAASRLCDRMIWLDRGRVILDGASRRIVTAYEDSIRLQEEEQLHHRRVARLAKLAAAELAAQSHAYYVVEISAPANAAPPAPVYFSHIELRRAGATVAALPLGPGAFDASPGSHLLQEGSSWSDPLQWQERQSRSMLNYGSPFHKVAGVMAVALADASSTLTLSVDAWSSQRIDLNLIVYRGRQLVGTGVLQQAADGWRNVEVEIAADAAGPRPAFLPSDSGTFGSGDIVIRNAAFVDASGASIFVLRHGVRAVLVVDYEILNPGLAERAQVAVAFHRDGVQDVCRFIARDLLFEANRPRGVVRLDIERLSLTDGTYSVSIMIAKEGYYDREQATFYSINPEVYSVRARLLEVMVGGSGLVGSGTIAVATGNWSLG